MEASGCFLGGPGGKKRAEAFEDLKKARLLAKEAGDKKVGWYMWNILAADPWLDRSDLYTLDEKNPLHN